MALGDNNSQKKDQKFEDTYYSRIKFNNREDKLSLGFSFWKGLLKISISSEKANYNSVTYEELIAIHLSPLKAMLLAKELEKFLSPENFETSTIEGYGINTGLSETQSIIKFNNEFAADGVVNKIVTIGKVDPNGVISNDITFAFNTDYHYSVEWANFSKMDCEKFYDNRVELELFLAVLKEFATAMIGATSYSVMDMGRFNNSRINTKIDLIMDALNIERKSSKDSGGNSSNSFFNNNAGAAGKDNTNRGRSNRTSIDDIGK